MRLILKFANYYLVTIRVMGKNACTKLLLNEMFELLLDRYERKNWLDALSTQPPVSPGLKFKPHS